MSATSWRPIRWDRVHVRYLGASRRTYETTLYASGSHENEVDEGGKRIVTIHRTYFTGASVDFELPTRGRAIVKYSGFEKHHRLLEYVIIGFYRKALELCGAKRVDVIVTVPIAQGGGPCELTLTWR
jgi:hypothetical protein